MGGIKTDPRSSRPLLYRDSQNASRNFGLTNTTSFVNSILPKPKFLFFVRFNRGAGAPVQSLGNLTRPSDGIVIQVKTIDRPKFNIKTETLNQYNKKRVIQTNIEYQNMTIAFHDDVSDKVMSFWAEYYAFYYGDGRKTDTVDWMNDIVTGGFNEGSDPGWGYLGDFGDNSENTHFLESIEILQFYGGFFTKMTFVHPKITIFDHDENDYADGREGSGIRMSFDFEGVIYDLVPQSVNEATPGIIDSLGGFLPGQISGRAESFGFGSTYFDVSSPFGRPLIPPSGGQTGLQQNSEDITESRAIEPKVKRLADAVFKDALKRVKAGQSVLSPSGFTFGGAGSLTSKVIDLATAVSSTGQVPSSDLLQKATGVRNFNANFGTLLPQTLSAVLANLPSARNAGFDSALVARAGSLFGEIVRSGEIPAGPGKTAIASAASLSKFKQVYGATTALAISEGLVESGASFPSAIDHASADAPTIINKLPDSSFQVTEIGALAFQTLREPQSAIGVNRPKNPWINPNAVNNNIRAIAAETNDPSLDISTSVIV